MTEEMVALLRRCDWAEVVRLASEQKKALRVLFKLLYHQDDHLHWLAAEAIGKYAYDIGEKDIEKPREIMRRLLWSLNEENGGSPWGSVEAIGAITVERPETFFAYVSIQFAFSEDETLLPGIIWTQAQMGRLLPGRLDEYRDFIIGCTKHSVDSVRGYAAWAIGELGWVEGEEALQRLAGDNAVVGLYERGGGYRKLTVAEIARESQDILLKRKK